MSSKIQELADKKLCSPPKWLTSNIVYETMMGSVAYGVSSDTSDQDIYGFAIPNRDIVFPHLNGEILGFGKQRERFEQYQQHHIIDKDAMAGAGRSHDVSIYNIVKYFQLVMENNPNMIDSLFTPQFCVLHITKIGNMVRDKRKMFLHKGAWPKFKGYAYSQLHKTRTKNHKYMDEVLKFEKDHDISHQTSFAMVQDAVAKENQHVIANPELYTLSRKELKEYHDLYSKMIGESKRAERVKLAGFDVKFAYHVIRLLGEVEQILMEGDLDIQRNREQLKSIRRGEVSLEEIERWASDKEKHLEELYATSKLQYAPDESKIKQLLLDCLEEHYGTLEGAFVNPDAATVALKDIQAILDKTLKDVAK